MAGAEKKIMITTVGLPGRGKSLWARPAGFDRTVSLDDWREKPARGEIESPTAYSTVYPLGDN
ncbi:MAG: ATP-binding protein [Desulfobacteraceae bacterium]|nr:ATP-binding protein [Desulfobacteraceae bacterium]